MTAPNDICLTRLDTPNLAAEDGLVYRAAFDHDLAGDAALVIRCPLKTGITQHDQRPTTKRCT